MVEQEPAMETGENVRVRVFYSSKSQPGVLDMYREAMGYLERSGIELEVHDISDREGRNEAREHGVVSTPSVVVERGGDEKRYLGIVEGMKDILEEDIYGRSILHRMAFDEGKKIGGNLTEDASDEHVEDVLENKLRGEGVEKAEIKGIDRESNKAEVEIEYIGDVEEEDRTHAHMEMILGGFFTSLFDTGVSASEERCKLEEEGDCIYTVGED